jgi:putative Mg2+ transporter-C (MgtC) family protein
MGPRLELITIGKLLLAFVLGAAIGYDRERHGKDAGIRTYAAVCMGSALFTFIGEQLQDTAAVSRIIANIVTGVGFLGAGIIYKNNASSSSQGLTTAATIWGTSAIGIAVGLDMYIISVVSAAALYFLLSMHHMKWYKRWKAKIADKEPSE